MIFPPLTQTPTTMPRVSEHAIKPLSSRSVVSGKRPSSSKRRTAAFDDAVRSGEGGGAQSALSRRKAGSDGRAPIAFPVGAAIIKRGGQPS